MKNQDKLFDIIFLGLAQNCEKYLPYFFNVVDELSKSLKIKVFIGENNSNDYTFDIIQKKIISNNVYEFCDTTFIEIHDDRIRRLALARQHLKNQLIKLNIKSKYVCVIDLDDVLNKTFNSNLIRSLTILLDSNTNKYFGVSVNSKPYYYDILNYEDSIFPNKNIKQLQNNKNLTSYLDRKNLIYKTQKELSKKKNIECISGFNGLCIYNFHDYILSNYLDNTNDQEPEHLLFNRHLNKILNKKILVTDNYLKMPNEHKPINSFFGFLFIKLLKYFNIYIKKLTN